MLKLVLILLAIVIFISLWLNYEKTLIFVVAFSPVMDLFYIYQRFGFYNAIALICIVVYLAKYRVVQSYLFYPMKGIAILTFFSILFSSLYNNNFFLSTFLQRIIPYFVPILLWTVLDKKENLQYLAKAFWVFLMIVVLYSFFELISGTNPVWEFVKRNSPSGENGMIYENKERFGIARVRSIFAYAGGLGYYAGLGFLVYGYIFLSFRQWLRKQRIIFLITLSCCLVGVFISGTRSAILAFGIGLLMFLKPGFIRRTYWLLFFGGIYGGLFLINTPYFQELINSFVDTESVSGSNVEMRTNQMNIVLRLVQRSPLLGNGLLAGNSVIRNVAGANGLESVWFGLIIDFGFVGAAIYLLMAIKAFWKFLKRNMFWQMFFLLHFFAIKTMTSVSGVLGCWVLYIAVALIRYHDIIENEQIIED